MGGASKILMLLTTPFPLLCPRPSSAALRLARHSRTAALSSLSSSLPFSNSTPTRLHPKSDFKSQLHSQSAAQRDYADSSLPGSAPISRGSASPGGLWPEWARLAENLTAGGYAGRPRDDDDEFVVLERLPEEFARAAEACLAFARDRPDALRLLGKKNIEVIVNSGSPSLFKNGASSARRMRLFLSGDESNVYMESDRAQTVDVMRYLLSYAYDSLNISEGIKNKYAELVEASIQSLLSEFVNMSGTVQGSKFAESTPRQVPISHEQSSRHPVQNVEMKRGDWVCPKCSFMNFARNSRCLECEEARPKRQLTGGEWECPQCDFFNYGRNMSCLRCDCKRPAEIPSTTPYGKVSNVDQILSRSNNDKSDLEQRLAANDEKAERWFNKVSQLGDKVDVSSAVADEDFPEIMPLRKGVNRFVVSTRKTPLERRLANSQSGVASGIGSDTPSESSINKSLDRILGHTSPAAGEADTGAQSGFNSADYRQSIAKSDPGYVPFVPLPPDMFSKPQNSNNEVQQKEDAASTKGAAPSDSLSRSSTNSTESRNYNEPSDSTERWSKKVAESDNVTDLASTIPDEDFPEIMPMRKGENRFVVSKKKDRSLTSPQYKRRLAMEQANKSDFVPFVPFPPGYFAKKDKRPEAASASASAAPINEAVAESTPGEKVQDVPEKLENRMGASNWGSTGGASQQPASATYSQSYNTQFSGNNWNESRVDYNKESSNSGISPMSSTSDSRTYGQSHNAQFSGNKWNESTVDNSKESWNSRMSQVSDPSKNASANLGPTQEPEKSQASSQNWKSFSGKSLEGSAVTEPDPLDMSEEAKTARWFRRAAQIKNISELSEIPDEDFPEIMPMRKGVNRFVVSKRKTPLERRLTSPQYRRNLPIVSSEPEKDAN